MPVITALKPQKRPGRFNLFLDGQFAFSISEALVLEHRLHPNLSLTPEEVLALSKREKVHQAMEAALRLLSYRPRSEAEVRQRLRRRQIEEEIIAEVIGRLRHQGLLDDAAFARYWRENRQAFSPRGRLRLRAELAQKGVSAEVMTQELQEVDEEAGALQAARKKLKTLERMDYEDFHRKLGAFLQRRGFGYELARRVVERLWQEAREENEPASLSRLTSENRS